MADDEHRRRPEELLAPLAVLVVLAGLTAYWVLRPTDEDAAAPAARDERSVVSPGASPETPDARVAAPRREVDAREPRRARLPEPLDPLASDLPAPSCPEPEPPVPVTVVDLNTAGAPTRTTYDHALLAEELRSFDADVYLLQEVDRPGPLARRLGMEVVHDEVTGATVLSAYPVEASGSAALPGRRATPRGVLAARLDVDGEPVDVYSTQLEEDDARLRVTQAQALREIVTAHDLPVVVGGDLGSGPDAAPAALLGTGRLRDSWTVVGPGTGETVPANAPRFRHDYLLADSAFAPLEADLLRSEVASHLAVRVTYDVATTPACLPPGSVN